MKKLMLLFGICLVLFTCGKDGDETAPNINIAQKFDLAVSASEGGSVDTSGGSYDSNSSVTITASPADGYEFTGWSGNASGSTNPLTVTVNGNKNITANFATLKLNLSVTASNGGSVNITDGEYDKEAQVSLVASPTEGYAFTGWTGGVTSSDNPLSLVMDEAKTITANFEQTIDITESADGILGRWSFGSSNSSSARVANCNILYIIFRTNETFTIVTSTATITGQFLIESNTTIRLSQNNNSIGSITNLTITNSFISLSIELDNNCQEDAKGNKDESYDENTDPLTTVFDESVDVNEGNESIIEYSFNEIDLDEPPFDGTIYITGDIITSSDPSLFSEIEYKGTGLREMFDRRNGGAWINIEPYLFDTSFSDGLKTEIQINPEFTLEEATVEANKYAFLIGQLPTGLRKDVQTMWIHKGEGSYGGGNNNLLVHTGESKFLENWWTGNIIEETLIHEATHTSIDAYHYPDNETDGAAWIDAVSKDDGCYISSYARDNPYREDLAELMPLYVAVRYFPDRISSDIRDKILSCNFNRIKYLDSLELDMSLYEN